MKGIRITDTIVIYNDMGRGWTQGKAQPLWHKKVYRMWMNMWRRVYTRSHYFGSLIYPPFKYLSNYVKWIEQQPRFGDFCSTCDSIRWVIDKDSKYSRNRDYYPDCMTLMTNDENSQERHNRNPNPKQPLLGIPLDDTKKIILTLGFNDVIYYEFNPSNVREFFNKKWKSCKGYKWYKVSYSHNKIYREK